MNLEINKPELVQRVQAQIDTYELIERALDALMKPSRCPR